MPYTTHGHWYGPGEPTQPGPRLVAKCFGLEGCYDCRTQAGLPPHPEPEASPAPITVYASIGNSDDKLTQMEWSAYAATFVAAVKHWAGPIHGIWHSVPDSPYQNMCACFEIEASQAPLLKDVFATTARIYRQDSIAWAPVPATEFISAAPAPEAVDHG